MYLFVAHVGESGRLGEEEIEGKNLKLESLGMRKFERETLQKEQRKGCVNLTAVLLCNQGVAYETLT